MCEIYVKADPRLYQKRRRSLRVGGVVTTLSLENQFWDTLEEMAAGEAISMPQLVGKLYQEVMDYHGEVSNFASFLRVCCMRYTTQVLPLQQANKARQAS